MDFFELFELMEQRDPEVYARLQSRHEERTPAQAAEVSCPNRDWKRDTLRSGTGQPNGWRLPSGIGTR